MHYLLEAKNFRDLGTNLNTPEEEWCRSWEIVCPGICELKDTQHQDCIYEYYSEYFISFINSL